MEYFCKYFTSGIDVKTVLSGMTSKRLASAGLLPPAYILSVSTHPALKWPRSASL